MVVRVSREEMAASILLPHFDAVRDLFAVFEPEPGHRLDGLRKVKFVIDQEMHDKPRHFAATRDDARFMYFAPEIVDLPVDTVVAIITHEFGHAADFAFPGRWVTPEDGPGSARWIRERDLDLKLARKWHKAWRERGKDQVEWAADAIAETVTGQRIGYCGDCMLQCFSEGGRDRPRGLR